MKTSVVGMERKGQNQRRIKGRIYKSWMWKLREREDFSLGEWEYRKSN